MKIKRGKHSTIFGALLIGDVFEVRDNIYLKIDSSSSGFNAFNLQKNSLDTFDTEDEVIKEHAELSVW